MKCNMSFYFGSNEQEHYKKSSQKRGQNSKEKAFVPTFYKALTKDVKLRIFVAARWVECSYTNDIIEKQIKQCVADRCKLDVSGEQLHLVQLVVRNISMKTHICRRRNMDAQAKGFQRTTNWGRSVSFVSHRRLTWISF